MKQGTMIPLDSLGAKGIFVGIITAIITTEIYCKICAANITIKMPKSVPPKCQNNGLLLPYRFNGANADTAGLIGDFQSARISLEELN